MTNLDHAVKIAQARGKAAIGASECGERAWHCIVMPDRKAIETRARRPPTASRAATEKRILRAAATVFANRSFDGATTAAIARVARMPKANLHYYFPTKADLYHAVLADILALWLDEARAWIIPTRDPADALAGYIRAKLALSRERPEASRIFASELLRGAPTIHDFLAGELRRTVATLASTIGTWHAAGRIIAPDPIHLLFAIWSMTQTYADFSVQMRAVLNKRVLTQSDFDNAAATVTQLVLRGCGLLPAIQTTVRTEGEFV